MSEQSNEYYLRIITQGHKEAIKAASDVAEAMGRDSDEAKRLDKALASVDAGAKGLAGGLKKLDGELKSLNGDLGKQGSSWDELKRRVNAAEESYKSVAQAAAAAGQKVDIPSFMSSQGVTGTDLSRYKQGAGASLLKDESQKAADAQARLYDQASPRLRYALYDVSRTAAVTAAAITGVGVAAVASSASFESSFTNVERTLDNVGSEQVAELRAELVGLTEEIPLAFSEITTIATLGNQLGIDASEIAKFTEVTAKFSTVTGMTAEASAQAFGSLGELLNVNADQYENLGSAIAYVGRRSVATEPEIVAMTTRLAASATNAGWTAQQVVALSGAFASLRIAPERAQGVMEVYFNRLNTAIANGGERLEAFAGYAGMASGEVREFAKSNPEEFFGRLATGLGQLDQVAQTKALEQLGLQGIRAGEVFGRVAGNIEVFSKALVDSDNSWESAQELTNQYAKTLDDLASQWQIFLNNVAQAASVVGDRLAPALGVALNAASKLFLGLIEFAQSPFGGWMVKTAIVIGGLVAAISGVAAVLAVGAGGLFAMRLAVIELGIVTAGTTSKFGLLVARLLGLKVTGEQVVSSNRVLASSTAATGAAADVAGKGMGRFTGALKGFARATIIIALLQYFTEWLFNTEAAARDLGNTLIGVGDFLNGAGAAVGDFIGDLKQPLLWLADALTFISTFGLSDILGYKTEDLGNTLKGWGEGALGWADSMKKAESAGDDFNETYGAFDWGTYEEDLNDASSATDGLGDSAAAAAAKVRTLVDYANDLSGVFNRAFEIRFGPQQGLDTITSGWQAIAKANQEAADAMAEYRRTLAELSADRSIKEYWLSVATTFGDDKRAMAIRADLAKLTADEEAAKKGLAEEQAKANKGLTGNSEAAIANRAALLGLVGNYQQYLVALASSGMSQADLSAKAAALKAEFVAQATQLGYNSAEIDTYSIAFDGVKTAIDRVPRDITVAFNADPAIQALNEFAARATEIATGAGNSMGDALSRSAGSAGTKAASDFANRFATQMNTVGPLLGDYAFGSTTSTRARSGGGSWGNPFAGGGAGGGGGGGFANGGYTGPGGKYDIAGPVHRGEFVFSQEATRNLGVSNLNSMHAAAKANKGFAPSGLASSGVTGVVGLDAQTIQALATAIRPHLYLDSQVISNSVGSQFARGTATGAN